MHEEDIANTGQTKMKGTHKTVDGEVDKIMEVTENIRKMAEKEANAIVNNAKKEAIVIKRHATISNNNMAATDKVKAGTEETRKLYEQQKYELCSRKVFKVIIDRERSRADRNGHELSLVMFDVDSEKQYKFVKVLLQILRSRSRTIDRFGWYNDKQIGVVLPNTSYKGSVKFVHDVSKKIIKTMLNPLSFKIYTYPTRWLIRNGVSSEGENKRHKEETARFIYGIDPIFTKKIPVWKRILDIVGSIFALILSSPLFIFVPLIIKISSRGPVFFKQERVGHGGKIFTFLKFRTMTVNNDDSVHQEYLSELIKSEKPMIKLDNTNDSRIIPLGRILRKACIDELPQLINVLRGEMSLVGPRPCLPYEVKEYLKWHKYRFDIRPGMTGLWQVSGKNRLSFKKMIRLDIMYSKKMNLFLDLLILLKTFPAIIMMIIDKIKIDLFFNKIGEKKIPEEQFKEFIRRYYSDIYNVDRLEFIDDKLKNYHIDLMELMLLLSRLHKLMPTYNVAKRYFGICRLIDFEKKSQLHKIDYPEYS